MKPSGSNQSCHAMTLVEVLAVIVSLVIVAVVILPTFDGGMVRAPRITCINNLHQVGLAYRSWAGDHNDKYPMEVSVTNGGTMELVANGNNAWLNYSVMSNELYTPKVLCCTADISRHYATSFSPEFVGKTSYFVGLDATCTNNPQAILSGDDNFEINGVPVKQGMLKLSTNHATAWTAARHKLSGNIGLADGSAQQLNNPGLTNLLYQTSLATNRLAIP